MSTLPLRLLVHDDTCRGSNALPGLSHAWRAGALLYRGLARIDATFGARTWRDALAWLATIEPSHPIGEIQFWGHGKWGALFVGAERLDASWLLPGHARREDLEPLRSRLVGPEALFWFRTCETFGAVAGHDFARAWTRFFGCRAAGHTFVIGVLQSGLHLLAPGDEPQWSSAEGLRRGTPEQPELAWISAPGRPNTITCFDGRIPAGF